jgi:hypothetical protein
VSLEVGSPKYAKAQRAFEARAQTFVGLRLAAVRYVGGIHNSAGYERGTGIDRLNFGAELVSDDGRCVYIEWESGESGDFKVAIHDCAQLVGRSVTDVSADHRWEPFVGETVTKIDVASHVDATPWVYLPRFLERPLDFFLLRGVEAAKYDPSRVPPRPWHVSALLARAAGWITDRIGREGPLNQYIPYGLTLHFGDRRVWLAAPREDDEGDFYSMSVVFEEDSARRLQLIV